MQDKKTISAVLFSLLLCAGVLAGCGVQSAANSASSGHSASSGSSGSSGHYTRATKIDTVRNDAAFKGYGRLMFPVQESYMSGSTLGALRLTWYHNMNPDKTVEIANYFYNQVQNGQTIFYNIYSDNEKREEPDKNDTGFFFFKGKKNAKTAIVNADGGFAYVGAMQDSFPVALELSKKGYNAVAPIYRPGEQTAYEDLSRTITYLEQHADELEIDMTDYSLWGGSAGARMANAVGTNGTAAYGEPSWPKPAVVVTQYTGLSSVTGNEPPTYANVGTSDWIADDGVMRRRINRIKANGTDAEIEVFKGLHHGFGLGEGTAAEGWVDHAVAFWQRHMTTKDITQNAEQTTTEKAASSDVSGQIETTQFQTAAQSDTTNAVIQTARRKQTASSKKRNAQIKIPRRIHKIPSRYLNESDQQGTLVDLYYDTWESFSYKRKTQRLHKHAVVYLPYGYDKNKRYDIFYLMHGGWSDENTLLGTPSNPTPFKNAIDHGIQNGEIRPIIIVCPTYNNTNENGRDSDDYTLALRLTNNFHNELENDLMPAVEGKYSTYAKGTTKQDFENSRNHRGFGGFSMGSVTTWHTFQHNLSEFRYFLPMSCGTSAINDRRIWRAARNYNSSDYFVFVMTGTNDFAYSDERARNRKMQHSRYFTDRDDNPNGNFAFRVKRGYSHDGTAADEYTYNGIKAFFPGKDH